MTEPTPGPAPVDEEIGARVHAAMWRAKVTQTAMARALGVDQAAVSRRLRGRTPWRVTDVLAAAAVCGVPYTDLVPDDGTAENTAAPAANTARASGNFRSEIPCSRRSEHRAVARAAGRWGTAELLTRDVAA